MRRSVKITLALLATGAGGVLTLRSCSDDAELFAADEAACTKGLAGRDDAADACGAMFRQAAVDHARTAPRFADRAACEEATGGSCAPLDVAGTATAPGGTPADAGAPAVAQAFIPVMAGVMIGRALAPAGGFLPVYGGRDPCLLAGRPDCGAAGGTAGGSTTASNTGSNTGTGGTTGSGARAAGRSFWYSGTSYVGNSAAAGSASTPRTVTSLSTGGVQSAAARAGRAGGFGASAAAHAGGGG